MSERSWKSSLAIFQNSALNLTYKITTSSLVRTFSNMVNDSKRLHLKCLTGSQVRLWISCDKTWKGKEHYPLFLYPVSIMSNFYFRLASQQPWSLRRRNSHPVSIHFSVINFSKLIFQEEGEALTFNIVVSYIILLYCYIVILLYELHFTQKIFWNLSSP